jgi:hypothetical protein
MIGVCLLGSTENRVKFAVIQRFVRGRPGYRREAPIALTKFLSQWILDDFPPIFHIIDFHTAIIFKMAASWPGPLL